LPSYAQQSAPAPAPIVPDGKTQTTVTVNGNVTGITTNTIRGVNGFNSFTTFNVAKGTTTNLFLPSATENLLNIVNGSRSTIDGVLNSIKNGEIGGRVFFINPYGLVVGSTGIVNVGALTVVTPTKSFISSFFDATGNVSDAAAGAVLTGNIPLGSDGLIFVHGRINALTDIRLAAGQVINSGTISTGAVFVAKSPDFSDVVNINGLTPGTALSTQNGNIEIVAQGDFQNSGVVATNGANNLNAGNISIQAGNDVRLVGNSVISSSGSGSNSNAGNISILANGNAYLIDHAQVEANGGDISGDGGSIEFSAKGTLNLDGGLLKAGAVNGTAGTVTLDPTDLVISANDEPNDGTNLDFTADNSITVNPGVTISSRQIGSGTDPLKSPSTGNSGNISFEAPQIMVSDGSSVLAHATGSFTPGDITMTANSASADSAAVAQASITIGNAVLSGRNITLTATSQATADNTINGFVQTTLNDASLGFLVTGAAAADTSSATSTITVGNPKSAGQATLNAAGDIAIASEAHSDTKVDIVGAPQGVAYGQANASATATIGSNATITAGGKFDLSAKTNDNLDLLSQTGSTTPLNVAVSYGEANSTSKAELDGQVTAEEIKVETENDNEFATEAKGFNNTGGGSAAAGIGVALGFYQSSATTSVPGSLTAENGGVNISASSTNDENATRSESEVTDKTDLGKIENQTVPFLGTLSGFIQSHSKTKPESNPNQFGLAAAVSYMSSSNKASSNVSGSVTADHGAVSIDGTATDNPKISAAGSSDGANVSIGGAVAIGNFTNQADATVTGSALITAANDVQVNADAEIPNPVIDPYDKLAQGFDFTGIDFSNGVVNSSGSGWGQSLWNDMQTLYNGVKGVQADVINPGAFFTSFTNTGLSAEGSGTVGLAGSVNLTSVTNQSNAHIAGTAHVTSDAGDVKVNATANATIINVAGMAFSLDSVLGLNPGVTAGSSLGGSYAGITLNNSSTAYIGDNTKITATAGNVNVASNTETFALNVVQSGDKAEKFGITGAFDWLNINDTSEAYIQSDATVSAGQDANVNATNNLKDFMVDGALGIGGTVQVGVTVGWNQIDNTTLAYIGDPGNSRTSICTGCGVTVGGDVNLNASSKEDVYAISLAATKSGSSGEGADGESSSQPTGETAPSNTGNSVADEKNNKPGDNGAGGGSYGFGISANIAFNQINDGSGGPGVTTEAFINNAAKVNATGDVNLNATDNSFVVAAGVAASLGQTVALAGAYSQNDFSKQVDAFTANSNLTAKGLDVNASTNSDLFNVTAGGSVNTQTGIALAGSVNNNSITNSTSAYVGDGTIANIGSDGTTISAGQTGLVVSVAGGLGISLDGGGVGAAVDIGDYNDDVSARVDAAKLNSAGNVQVTASNNGTLWPVAVSLAFGTNFGADGSVAYEKVTNNTTAAVNGTLATDSNLVVGSNDQTNINMIAGGLGVGGDVGVSISAVIPSVSRTTEATIGGSADVTALGFGSSPISYEGDDVVGTLVQATSGGSLSDYAIAGAIAGKASAAGAVIINPLSSSQPDTLLLDTEANIDAGAKVNSNNAGADAKQSVVLNANDSTGITDVAGMLSVGGYFGGGVGYDQIQPNWTVSASIGKNATVDAAADVILNSTLKNSVHSYAVAVSASAGAALSGAASRINETSTSSASIDGTVSAGGSVVVAADRNGKLNTLDGNGAVGLGAAGVGLSLSMITANDTVEASIGPNGNVTALGQGSPISAPTGGFDDNGDPVLAPSLQGLSVSAMNYSSLKPLAVGAAASGGVAVDGSVIVNTLTESTSAKIQGGAIVNGDNAGAADGQSVNVLASDTTNMNDLAGALSVSLGAGIGAAADAGNIKKTTTAGIDNGAAVHAKGAVTVDALSEETIKSIVAAVGGALNVGVAGSVGEYSINPISPTTTAYIGSCTSASNCAGGATVTAGAVSVKASDDLTFTEIDGAAGIGGIGGLGAAVLDVTNNANTEAYIGVLSNVTSNAGETEVVADFTDKITGTALAGSGGVVAGNASVANLTDDSNSSAFIADKAVVNSHGDLDVSATSNRTIDGTSSGLTVGAVAAGASITNVTINGGTSAYVGDANVTSQTDALNVTANLTDSATATASGIGGGVASGVGTHPEVTDNAKTDAYATGGAVLWSAGTTDIDAEAVRTLTASSGGISVGGLAVGVSLAEVNLGGETHAYTESGAQVGTSANSAGGLTVAANETDTASASANPLAGGVVAGIGGQTNVNLSPDVSASLTGTTVYANENVSVDATEAATATSTVQGVQLGAITGGSADAQGSVTPQSSANPMVSASIDGGSVQAKTISVDAKESQTLDVESSSSASSSFVSGMNIKATATASPTVSASVGGGANLTASGDISVSAASANSMSAVKADGAAGAFSVGSGGNATANATITNKTSATVGAATITSSAGNLTVQASSNNSLGNVSSNTYAGSGLVNVGGATSNATTTDQVTTTLGSGSDLEAPAGNLVVASYGSENVGASATNPNGLSGVAQSNAETDVNITANVATNVQNGAQAKANDSTITAAIDGLAAGLNADASSNASANGVLGVGAYATSIMNTTATSTVEISNGATVTGDNGLTLNAEINKTRLANSASAVAKAGIVPIAEATAINNANLAASVQVDPGSTLVSNSLTVNAIKPPDSAYSNSAYAHYTFYAIFGIPISGTGTENTGGSWINNNLIGMDGTLQQPANFPALLVDADGGYSGPLKVLGEDTNNIVLKGIGASDALQNVVLNAPGGTVEGSMGIDPNLLVVNNSNLNLVIQDISAQGGGSGNITVNAAVNSLKTLAGPMPITIENNSGSNVVFAGNVADPGGSLSVTNQGGNVFSTQNSKIQVTSATLNAPHGAIGSTGGEIPCSVAGCPASELQLSSMNLFITPTLQTLTETLSPGQLSAVARNDIDLNLTPDATPLTGAPVVSSVPLQLSKIVAGGDINLGLNPGVVSANGGQRQVNGDYQIPSGDWVGAGGDFAAVLNGTNGATPKLTVDGTLTSGFESLSVTANADGTFTSIVSAAGAGSADLTYVQSAGSVVQVGNIDASRSGISITGTGDLAGSGTLALLNGASDITIANHSNLPLATNTVINTGVAGTADIALNGTVSITPGSYGSPSGQINVSSDSTSINLQNLLSNPNGSISVNSGTDITGPTGVTLIRSKNIQLQAGGSIGPDLGIEMTQPLGVLDAKAGGSIVLTANGDISVGNVTSQTGDVSMTASGSIISASSAYQPNIFGRNLTLTANNGAIGSSDGWLSTQATGVLNASAGSDVFLRQINGDLNSQNMISRSGSINLIVDKGNGYLQNIRAPQHVLLLLNGNLLKIGVIDSNNIKAMLAGRGGVATVDNMFVGAKVDFTADILHILHLVHTSPSNPLIFDITTTQGGFNERPLDPGIVLANSFANWEHRDRERRFSLKKRAEPAADTVIDMTNKAPKSGAAQ
jgi:filamentous hemagglutinin family protein